MNIISIMKGILYMYTSGWYNYNVMYATINFYSGIITMHDSSGL